MGFFSFITMDTNKSVSNVYSSLGSLKVSMVDDKGNVWEEDNYEGYGMFNGKDYFELLAEMNGVECNILGRDYTEYMRSKGISLFYSEKRKMAPNIVENANGWVFLPEGIKLCQNQGYFY